MLLSRLLSFTNYCCFWRTKLLFWVCQSSYIGGQSVHAIAISGKSLNISFFPVPNRLLPSTTWPGRNYFFANAGLGLHKKEAPPPPPPTLFLAPPLSSSSSGGGQLYGTNSPANGHSGEKKNFSLFSSAVYHGQTETPAAEGRSTQHTQAGHNFLFWREKEGKRLQMGWINKNGRIFKTLSMLSQKIHRSYIPFWVKDFFKKSSRQ